MPIPYSTTNQDPKRRQAIIDAYQKYLHRMPSDAEIVNWYGESNFETAIANSPEAKAAPAAGTSGSPATRETITAAYQKYLGRAPSEAEVSNWIGNNNYEAEIAASPEAKAKASGTAWNPRTGNTQAPPGFDPAKWNDPNKTDPKYDIGRILAQHVNDPENALRYIQQLYPGTTFDGKDTLDIPGVGKVDVLQARSTGAWQPTWQPVDGFGGAGGGSGGAGGGGGDGSGSGGGGTSGTSGFEWPQFQGPALPAGFTPPEFQAPPPFAYEPFTPPTLQEAQAEPGYQFAMQEGTKALENSAAARGVLRTGGTLKDLFSWGNKFGEQNYGNVYNRAQGTYGTNRANAADIYSTNYNVSRDVFDKTYQGARDKYQSGLDIYGLANQEALNEFNPRFEQARLTFADLYNRWKTGVDATTQVATSGYGL